MVGDVGALVGAIVVALRVGCDRVGIGAKEGVGCVGGA